MTLDGKKFIIKRNSDRMILIISTSGQEWTTEVVMDWIYNLGGKVMRINGSSIYNQNENILFDINKGVVKLTENTILDIESINVVWYRRFGNILPFTFTSLDHVQNTFLLREDALRERNHLKDYFFHLLKDKKWFPVPSEYETNKLVNIKIAEDLGFEVADTIVTNDKEEALLFIKKHNGTCITKPISYSFYYHDMESSAYSMYTEKITSFDIESLDSNFAPTLFQELVEKKFEIRVFIIDDIINAVAKFTLNESESQIDLKQFKGQVPCVRYKLPQKVIEKIRTLMFEIGLSTGSMDLIKTESGYLFLEVNPVGQFGYESFYSNENWEKLVAKKLIQLDL